MLRLEKQVKKIMWALELQRTPIAARFSENPDKKGINGELRICEAFNVIRQENVIVNLSKENCTCKGGRYYAGWQTLSPEELPEILLAAKAYESKETAEASVNKQPPPKCRGKFLILGPLNKFETDPDVVLFFVNPAQADRILGLISYKGAKPFMHYPVTSMCSTIAYALAKRKPDINFISIFERRRGKWSPNELIITLPFKEFLAAIKNISRSGFGRLPGEG